MTHNIMHVSQFVITVIIKLFIDAVFFPVLWSLPEANQVVTGYYNY